MTGDTPGAKPDGLLMIASGDSYTATVERLDAVLDARTITPMLRWDHAAAAAQVGLVLRPNLLVVFGDPRVGTALMQQQPTMGIDLPLKLLIWEAENGTVWVGYKDPAWTGARHGLAPLPDPLGGMAAMLNALAMTVAGARRE